MGYENILYEKKDGIAYITFNRPKVLNALNNKTIDELRQALVDARDDGSVRVLILAGAGEKAFVAGADIGELAQRTPVDGKEFSVSGQGVTHLLETMGICTWRGVRAGALLLDSHCKQERETRAAGGETRHHSRIRWIAASRPALWEGCCA